MVNLAIKDEIAQIKLIRFRVGVIAKYYSFERWREYVIVRRYIKLRYFRRLYIICVIDKRKQKLRWERESRLKFEKFRHKSLQRVCLKIWKRKVKASLDSRCVSLNFIPNDGKKWAMKSFEYNLNPILRRQIATKIDLQLYNQTWLVLNNNRFDLKEAKSVIADSALTKEASQFYANQLDMQWKPSPSSDRSDCNPGFVPQGNIYIILKESVTSRILEKELKHYFSNFDQRYKIEMLPFSHEIIVEKLLSSKTSLVFLEISSGLDLVLEDVKLQKHRQREINQKKSCNFRNGRYFDIMLPLIGVVVDRLGSSRGANESIQKSLATGFFSSVLVMPCTNLRTELNDALKNYNRKLRNEQWKTGSSDLEKGSIAIIGNTRESDYIGESWNDHLLISQVKLIGEQYEVNKFASVSSFLATTDISNYVAVFLVLSSSMNRLEEVTRYLPQKTEYNVLSIVEALCDIAVYVIYAKCTPLDWELPQSRQKAHRMFGKTNALTHLVLRVCQNGARACSGMPLPIEPIRRDLQFVLSATKKKTFLKKVEQMRRHEIREKEKENIFKRRMRMLQIQKEIEKQDELLWIAEHSRRILKEKLLRKRNTTLKNHTDRQKNLTLFRKNLKKQRSFF